MLRVRRSPEDAADRSEHGATVVDFLDLLRSAMADHDPSYEVAVVTSTTSITVPADTESGTVDLHLTDRDVLLVREDVRIERTAAGVFDARLTVLMAGETATVTRGYDIVDITIDGIPVTVSTTHLESAAGAVRRQQARELLERLPTDRSVVLAGDFNAGPATNPDTYDLLVRSFQDVAPAPNMETVAPTCCHPPHLRNAESTLEMRVDTVLYRGRLHPRSTERVGVNVADRITDSVDGREVKRWPSDHAGVLATLTLRAAAPTPGRTRTQSSTDTSMLTESATPNRTARRPAATKSGGMDGFDLITAVCAFFVAYMAGVRSAWDPE